MKSILLILGSIALVGCGSPKIWYQSGKSPDETRRDLGQCQTAAIQAGNIQGTRQLNGLGYFMMSKQAQNQSLEACMLGKGYVAATARSITNGEFYPQK